MDIENFLASFPYAASTRRTYESILCRLRLDLSQELSSLSAAELLKFVEKSEWGNARRCLALACCQKYLGWRYGQLHPALHAKLKRITGKPQRALTPVQALELLASFDPYTAKGARDLAICALALDTGLRASELCRLQLADTDLDRCVLQVICKGSQ